MAGLDVRGLSVSLFTRGGVLPALSQVSLSVQPGRTLALVGESGCGKSMTALAIMRLLPEPPARIIAGQVMLGDTDLAALPERRMLGVRGKAVSMIFQDPMSSLNPVVTVGDQIIEVLRRHEGLSGRAARTRATELLALVGISDAEARLDEYPHRLSGGMCQRVMIAIAIACRPAVLVADEPTTALDVTVQAQILELLKRLQAETGMALLLITHDLGVVAEMADEVAVMYAGRVVEQGPVDTIFAAPLHPYTRGLLGATPSGGTAGRHTRLADIPGSVPSLAELPAGCAFAPRCKLAHAACTAQPPLKAEAPAHLAACFAAQGMPADAA